MEKQKLTFSLPSWILFQIITVLLISTFLLAAPNDRLKKPNVIVILSDDQGYGDITSHGNRMIDTPNLDLLAVQGARFENFFVSPLCAPTRASLLTGRYHIRTGATGVSNGREVMRSDEITLAELFRANGYNTAAFGKWHNGEHFPNNATGQGFDEFLGFSAGHIGNYFNSVLEHNGDEVQTSGFITDVLTDHAMSWIESHKDSPFFVYLPYNAPHSPYQAPDDYFDKYVARGFDNKNSAVYGMVENMDHNIGRLLRKVDDLELTENTIVIFLTDNGPNTPERYNGGMKGHKGKMDEGGVRVPLFVQWAGTIAAGQTLHQLSAHIDILPTLMELAQLSYPQQLNLDGVSLVPLLLSQETPSNRQLPSRSIFSHRLNGKYLDNVFGTVRTERFRYVRSKKIVGLYDMVNDPSQEKNIKGKQKKIFKQLKQGYQTWYEDVTSDWRPSPAIGVGYAQSPTSRLQAVEAKLQGKLKFHGKGYAHDWIENWVDVNDVMSWDINIIQAGRYRVSLDYVVAEQQLGAQLRVAVGDATISNQVTVPFDPPIYPAQDRHPRLGVYEKPWKNMVLGEFELAQGQMPLVLSCEDMPGEEAVEVRRINVTLLEPSSSENELVYN